MIPAFPDLYPDELMYSGCARYAYRLGYPNLKNIMSELFGSQQVIASVPFSSHLDYFVANQPRIDRFTTETLIANYTLLPFYAPFLPPDRVEQLYMDMRGNGSGIYMRVGLMASTVPSPKYLRYCPKCAKEDQKCFGEKYWHRLHQIPGIVVCHTHNTWLEDSIVSIHNRKTRHEFVAAEEVLQSLAPPRSINGSSNFEDTLLFIAKGAAWLLGQQALSLGPAFLYAAYRQALINQELALYNGRMRMRELQEAFASYYPCHVLSYLHCPLDMYSSDNWLARLVRKPDGSQHPLQHLLLMHFLNCTIETFFLTPLNHHPFGSGPWPCLNPASDHYRCNQIGECQIKYSHYAAGRPIGTFSCSCGFIYTRTGPDVSVEDQFHLTKIKAFGQTWEEKLRTLWCEKSVSLRGIARQLGADPLTIKRHAARLNLPFPRTDKKSGPLRKDQQLRPSVNKLPDVITLEDYRAKWLNMRWANSEANISTLRKEASKIYSWLYRNDKVWLKAHKPTLIKKLTLHSRVDWEKRDIQLVEEMKSAADRLKSFPGRPVQITRSALARELSQGVLIQQHLDKLPRTANVLEALVETREAFAIRKIVWVAQEYRLRGICPKYWQLVKDAGIERLTKDLLVTKAINSALNSFV